MRKTAGTLEESLARVRRTLQQVRDGVEECAEGRAEDAGPNAGLLARRAKRTVSVLGRAVDEADAAAAGAGRNTRDALHALRERLRKTLGTAKAAAGENRPAENGAGALLPEYARRISNGLTDAITLTAEAHAAMIADERRHRPERGRDRPRRSRLFGDRPPKTGDAGTAGA